MKKFALVLILAAALGACGTDNSSSVTVRLDGNGCLIEARDFDWSEESQSATLRTVNYRWECGSYTSLRSGRGFSDSRVTLTFTGTTCLQLTAEIIGAGYCTSPKTTVN